MFIIIDQIPYHYTVDRGFITLHGCKDSPIFRHPPKDAQITLGDTPVTVNFCDKTGTITFDGVDDPDAVVDFLDAHIDQIDDGWHTVERV